MDLIAYAVPFFLLLLLIELAADLVTKAGRYRLNDAVNSLSAGMLNSTTGYFTKFLPLLFWGLVLENFAILDLPLEAFDLSLSGMALWITALLAWDFCYYWFHRYSHEISVLWAAHAVHHQSEEYNLSTALRQTSTGFLLGWIFYLPLFLIGFPLEVLLLVNAINLIYQFWVHTQFVGRLGMLDYILVTPSNHRVHHAQNEVYIDRNYGGMLIVWDRMFGTFQDELVEEPVVYGVRKALHSWNPFYANLQVYALLWRDAWHARRWADKLRTWFGRTGWRPADVAAQYPLELTDPAALTKFNPEISRGTRNYVLLQFAASTALILWISVRFAGQGASAVVVPCIVLWATLYTMGLFTEGKRYAWPFELIRILLLLPLGVVLVGASSGWLPLTVAVYGLASVIYLIFINKNNREQVIVNVK
ncbi:MAG: sterol desaturase family protein [Woeseiaceae bacterium]